MPLACSALLVNADKASSSDIPWLTALAASNGRKRPLMVPAEPKATRTPACASNAACAGTCSGSRSKPFAGRPRGEMRTVTPALRIASATFHASVAPTRTTFSSENSLTSSKTALMSGARCTSMRTVCLLARISSSTSWTGSFLGFLGYLGLGGAFLPPAFAVVLGGVFLGSVFCFSLPLCAALSFSMYSFCFSGGSFRISSRCSGVMRKRPRPELPRLPRRLLAGPVCSFGLSPGFSGFFL